MKKLLFLLLALLLGACSVAPAPAATATPAPTPFTFMAGYKPQANLPFVGVYLAQENGYFAAEGLDVTIQHATGGGEHLQLLAAGKVQVTTQDAAVLLQRRVDPGLPLVSIALIGQRGQQAYAALASSGLQTPQDWEGRLVGYKGTPPPDLFALLHAAGVDPQKLELVNVGFDPRLLTEGKVDVYPVFKSNEPYLIRSWGYDVTLWDAADYGIPTLGLTYVTSDEILRQQPEALAGFLRAALHGIEYAGEHPDEAVQAVLKYAGPETDPEHMRFMLESELADARSAVTEQYGLGWQTAGQWQDLADMLAEYDIIPQTDATPVFTTQVLEAAQEKGK
ncbi:MAG: ABC transporter substrate-binding protein [Anaerolineaceae bacterium]|nr:ABC transporter substrate-binding protein [Anaerolineaceae bacterium]